MYPGICLHSSIQHRFQIPDIFLEMKSLVVVLAFCLAVVDCQQGHASRYKRVVADKPSWTVAKSVSGVRQK
jgi:hypothetical protein